MRRHAYIIPTRRDPTEIRLPQARRRRQPARLLGFLVIVLFIALAWFFLSLEGEDPPLEPPISSAE